MRAAHKLALKPNGRPVAELCCVCPTPSLQAKAAQKQAAALQSALTERMQACTFRPQTNQARRREQLARLLGEGEDADLAAPLQDGY